MRLTPTTRHAVICLKSHTHTHQFLPLIVEGTISSTSVDNIVVALGQSDRVCRISGWPRITEHLRWDKLSAAMQVPFLALIDLGLLRCENAPPRPPTLISPRHGRLKYAQFLNFLFGLFKNLKTQIPHSSRSLHSICSRNELELRVPKG